MSKRQEVPWYVDGKVRIAVESGPLKGREFDDLWDLLDEKDVLRRSCLHKYEKRQVLVGKNTDSPKIYRSKVCRHCGDSYRTHIPSPVLLLED